MGRKKSEKVLIVGNDPRIAVVAKQKSQGNQKPIKVSSGEEALQVASKLPPFDLVLTDIMTPAINGVDFAEHFTKLYPQTNVLYIVL